MQVVSLGAGVQSSAMLLMGLEGRFGEKPDVAIFADTGWEPKAVYEWLAKLEEIVAPFQIVRVSAGNIRADAIAGIVPSAGESRRFASLPFFLLKPDGSAGMGRRQCSSEYKIRPLRRYLRATGVKRGECWIGISTDEADRMKPADVKWLPNRWPLIESGMNRNACADYLMERVGAVAPKSSCVGCPFHDDAHWETMRLKEPEEFADACEFDRLIRRTGRTPSDQFVHDSLVPLGEIKEFRHSRQGRMFTDKFGMECEGVCGV